MNAIPSDDEIRSKVLEIVASHAKIDLSTLTPQSTLTDLGMPSLTVIEAIFDIEEKFDIDLPADQFDFNNGNLQQLLDLIRATISASRGAPAA